MKAGGQPKREGKGCSINTDRSTKIEWLITNAGVERRKSANYLTAPLEVPEGLTIE